MTDSAGSSSQRPARDLSGRQLGDYRLLRRLGRGAMAEVYLAEQRSLGRKVAVKVLKSDLAEDETYIRRFHVEARAAASLVHAAIVQIYEVGQIDGIHFMAQEYVPGQNLAEVLARRGPPSLKFSVGVMRQVAAALTKAAGQGIVHRDIKPENLMLSDSGEVKVADFGLARITQNTEQLKLTQMGVTMGSPLYMSPEQVEGKALDPRSDIYSFGVTCYQMLAGRPPYTGDTALSVAVQHLRSQPERLENLRPDLPPGLCRIVHKMLAKDPGDRFATGAEVLRELRALDIPDLNGDWPDDLEQCNTAEIVALSGARSAATQQLAAVMTSSGRQAKPLLRQKVFWLAVGLALLFGILIGWPRAERPLLEVTDDVPSKVPQLGSAQEQYLFATQLGTEQSWRSVLEFYPDNENYVRMAKKQLADTYLNQDRFDEARRLFDDFARLGDSEPEYHAYGLAGQYVIYTLEDSRQQAADKFALVWKQRDKLQKFDPRMTQRVYRLARKNRQADDRQQDQEIDDWLKRHVEDDDPTLDE